MSDRAWDVIHFFVGLVLILIVVAVVAFLVESIFLQPLVNQRTFTATVVKTYVDGGDTFFVLQESDKAPQPYSNNDNLFFGKFNSGDFLVNLSVGQTYTFTTVGWRVPLFSQFPNIVRYEGVTP